MLHKLFFKLLGLVPLNFGLGGGGDSGGVYYKNQDKLFGAQADIATELYNQYAGLAPGYLKNTQTMTDEAMSGKLATRARNRAGADASQAFSSNMASINRGLSRFGSEFNPNALRQQQAAGAVEAAAGRADAMNGASEWAEDQKWNRNAGAYGQIAGMGTGAMQGLGSAGAGYGQMAYQQGSANAANAAGYGKFGAAVGTSLFKADGGFIKKHGLRLADGGFTGSRVRPMKRVDWRTQETGNFDGSGPNPAAAVASGLAPSLMAQGLRGAKDYLVKEYNAATAPKAGEFTVGQGGDFTVPEAKGLDSLPEGVSKTISSTPSSGGEALASTIPEAATSATGTAATGAEVAGLAQGVAPVVGEMASGAGAAATEALATGATEAALGTTAAANSWNPVGWVTAAGLLANQLFKADGGEIQDRGLRAGRKDFKPGGKVSGPGTETSDDIPAWLSDGEFVLNAEAVKMVGKDKLEEINEEGLEKREGKSDGDEKGLRAARKPGVKLAGGGYLGVALGSAADEMARQRELARADKAEERASKTFEQQEKEWARLSQMDSDYAEAAKIEDPKARRLALAGVDKRKAFENEGILKAEGQRDEQLGLSRQQVEGMNAHYKALIEEHGKDRADKMIIAQMNDARMRQQLAQQAAQHAASLKAAGDRDGKVINALDKDGNLVPVVVKGTSATPINLPQGLRLPTAGKTSNPEVEGYIGKRMVELNSRIAKGDQNWIFPDQEFNDAKKEMAGLRQMNNDFGGPKLASPSSAAYAGMKTGDVKPASTDPVTVASQPMTAEQFSRDNAVDLTSNDPLVKLTAVQKLKQLQDAERAQTLSAKGLRGGISTSDWGYRPALH